MTEVTTTIPPVPRLEGDRGIGLEADSIVERHLAWALLHYMQQAYPSRPVCVDDGDERPVPARDLTHAMEMIFAVNDSIVRCGGAWAWLVCGNGVDFISDYGDSPATGQAVRLAEIHVGTRQEDDE
jgi:hypothetical protein